ncbi:alpha-1,4-glucan lyase [Pyronema omphalodes]|nr:alpha-1,4-glucan lyase [Pyronema omphalodes]
MSGISDPLNYCRAEDYFDTAKAWGGPKRVVSVSRDPPKPRDPTACSPYRETHYHGLTLTFDDVTLCVVQFIRPTVFRVRYDPSVRDPSEYGDENSRTTLQNYNSQLIYALDTYRGVRWRTVMERGPLDIPTDKRYWKLTSEVTASEPPLDFHEAQHYEVGDGMSLIIYEEPFKIQAIRRIKPVKKLYSMPWEYSNGSETEGRYKIVWESSPRTFRWNRHPEHPMLKEVIMDIIKPGPGEYIGFGEQGGTNFMKKATFMNYFNCDNMQYQQIYNKGALDPREPLYHSDPFYLEVNGNPEHANVTATYIDNYSQIAIDFGKTNSGYIKVGTRFNAMDVYILSANNVPEIVRLQSGIVGRGMLKPRYVLGNHQACYGYSTAEELHEVVDSYRKSGIPLDGMHLDVDFQHEFRTFTMNPKNNPKTMFRTLREKGIKCATNITPVISTRDKTESRPNGYKTLQEGLLQNRFILDERYTAGTSGKPEDVRYFNYAGGEKDEINPNDTSRRPDYGDDYDFSKAFNSLKPYRGAVSYGYNNGTPGHYVDLSTEENRIWWGKQYKELFDLGLEFVWQDMTTPSIGEAYGDMKGFPSRLLLNSDAEKKNPKKQLAIEIWALYSYNLHKATYHGLGRIKGRENKRNFILGRGSFASMFRFAGLWSGDNASTWNFWRITIPQVLSVGLNGVSISGSDTGGFEPAKRYPGTDNDEEEKYCSPELLIRWYAGSFLLPWLRNHYVRKNRKWFQEPYQYPIHFAHCHDIPRDQAYLYNGVESITRYYVCLRYSLMQVLYDAMFENLIHGLPIARSMLLTDTQDTSFFNETKEFLNNQYMCGRDILVAPIMQSTEENPGNNRDVYLPLQYMWYHSNLRPDDGDGCPLGPPVEGGTVINYTARITDNPAEFPFVTPCYIREGSIIPQLKVRQYVDDYREGPNHIRFNIYPGKDREYFTYLDDGVSRSSAPKGLPQVKEPEAQAQRELAAGLYAEDSEEADCGHVQERDGKANSEFRKVGVYQSSSLPISVDSTRTIRIVKEFDNYNPTRELGTSYTLVVYYGEGIDTDDIEVEFFPKNAGVRKAPSGAYKSERELRAVIVTINETLGESKEIIVRLTRRELKN